MERRSFHEGLRGERKGPEAVRKGRARALLGERAGVFFLVRLFPRAEWKASKRGGRWLGALCVRLVGVFGGWESERAEILRCRLLLLPVPSSLPPSLSLSPGPCISSWRWRRGDDEAAAVAAPSKAARAVGAGLGAVHAPGAAPRLFRGQGREGGGGGPAGRVAARVPALPEPGGGAGRVGLGPRRGGGGGGEQRDGEREPGAGAGPPPTPAVPARDVADGLVLRGRALQPAPGGLLFVRAHVAPLAGAVPGGRAEPPGSPTGHAPRPLPLRLLRPAPLRAAALLLLLLLLGLDGAQPEHGLALRLAHQQGHLLSAALPRGGGSTRVGGAGGRRGLRAALPSSGPAGAGGRVPQGAAGGGEGRAPPGPLRLGPAPPRPGTRPARGPALPRPARRPQLPPPRQARPPPGEPPSPAQPRRDRPRQVPRPAAPAARRVAPQRGAGGHLPGLAARPPPPARRPAAPPRPSGPPALRGPGARPPRAAPPPPTLRRTALAARPRGLRPRHDPAALRGRPPSPARALSGLRARRPPRPPRLEGAPQPSPGPAGRARLRTRHAPPRLPAQPARGDRLIDQQQTCDRGDGRATMHCRDIGALGKLQLLQVLHGKMTSD